MRCVTMMPCILGQALGGRRPPERGASHPALERGRAIEQTVAANAPSAHQQAVGTSHQHTLQIGQLKGGSGLWCLGTSAMLACLPSGKVRSVPQNNV